MYLKSLRLKGFKSFADKSQLQFEPGMTVIVGPNGSGKSNISDAILWVLGEQSAKQLRGNAMEDVIFSGSSARKPLSLAEVDLVLDNSDHLIPLDFEEIAITRRMYRSGESEYLINGSPARLMDIQDILHDSGLGKDTHSIISQGKLDSILQSRPEERRVLIEEAAGIAKHKKRKERSLKKVERMDKHLTRAQDIQKEILRQLRPLERQVDKAQRYQELSAALSKVKLSLAVEHLRELQESWSGLELQIKEAQAALELASYRVQEKEKELSKLQLMLEEHGLFVGDLTEQRTKMQSILQALESTMRLLEEKGRNMVLRLSELRASMHKHEQELKLETEELKALDLEAAQAQAKESKLQEQMAVNKETLAQARTRRIECDQELSSKQAQLKTCQDTINSFELKLAKLNDSLSSVALEDSLLANRIEQLSEELSTKRELLREHRQQEESLKADLELKEKKQLQLSEELTELNYALEHSKQVYQDIDSGLKTARAQLFALEEYLREQSSGDELSAFLRTEHDNATSLGQELEPLLSLIEARPGYEGLLETLFKEELASYLCSSAACNELFQKVFNKESAVQATHLFWLDHNISKLEPARDSLKTQEQKMICLSESLDLRAKKRLEELSEQCEQLALSSKPCLAADFIYAPLALHPILSAYFSSFVVLDKEDLLSAQFQDCSREFSELSFVCREGHSLRAGFLYQFATQLSSKNSGSSQVEDKALPEGLLLKQAKIKELKSCLPDLEAQLDTAKRKLEQVEAAIVAAREEQQKGALELAQVKAQFDICIKELDRLEQAIAQGDAELIVLGDKRKSLIERSKETQEQIEHSKQNLEELSAEKGDIESLLIGFREKLEKARYEERQAHQERSRLDIDSATVLERIKHLSTRCASLRSSLEQRQNSISMATTSAKELELRGLRVEPLHAACTQLIARAEEWAAKLRDKAKLEEAGSKDLKDTIQKARDLVHEMRLQEQEAQKNEQEHLLKKASLDVQVQAALEAITSQPGVVLEEALLLPKVEDKQALNKELKQLSKDIENIGPINQVAMEEYLKLKERYEHVSSQLADLAEARKALSKIIQAIDRKMKDSFLSTYNKVNKEFAEMFAALFPGGKAQLEMTEPDNPTQSGIEVIAQPRGKRLSKMMLLSGGEKSLTALALLFAVYKTRTVPFYVLDEVEAALDDANLSRLLAALQTLREKTQLIVVSHQRRTMEQADVLYGVSMQADGVSQLVSQKLENYKNGV